MAEVVTIATYSPIAATLHCAFVLLKVGVSVAYWRHIKSHSMGKELYKKSHLVDNTQNNHKMSSWSHGRGIGFVSS